ncbi:AlkA N-terminal domain-containing protein [Acidithiobacillus ferrivorans]|uniref:DNA-3-methyladenine glycosylase II n=1 Tax=Acidithiobacillus ferrivorans TaxID=160808 RepID=A0A7T5BI46_9PROT|nr:AlkA N-terminal domain-containing protein [Acidithiobacillus ferrivorans]QQD74049.1 helix-turn-helix domain-containing protein [Acidithiobacillus ferrivorans]
MNTSDLNREVCYRAVLARDARFDGKFYTAVLSTGIYCRPVCPARPPKLENCLFVPSTAVARQLGFRACLRCRPELVGAEPFAEASALMVSRALQQMNDDGALNGTNLDEVAVQLGVSGRHLRRLFVRVLGSPPTALAQMQRILLAKKLIAETGLSMTDVALAAGFGSVRRFNAVMQRHCGCAPGVLRHTSASKSDMAAGITMKLPYTPPYDWAALLEFLAGRAIPGVEAVQSGQYWRSFQLEGTQGLVEVHPDPANDQLLATIHATKTPPIGIIVARLRRLFDLDTEIIRIDQHLSTDPLMASRVRARPGLRVPGAWDLFELTVRAILGQQISVAAATTLSGRLVAALGGSLTEEMALLSDGTGISRIFPTPAAVMAADLGSIGLTRAREKALQTLAVAMQESRLAFSAQTLDSIIENLCELPGIGPWTAHYIAMRGYRDPDAFPHSDLGLLRALETENGRPSPAAMLMIAEAWRPWRAYAAMRLWAQP